MCSKCPLGALIHAERRRRPTPCKKGGRSVRERKCPGVCPVQGGMSVSGQIYTEGCRERTDRGSFETTEQVMVLKLE